MDQSENMFLGENITCMYEQEDMHLHEPKVMILKVSLYSLLADFL
jgi:hypothetical protein